MSATNKHLAQSRYHPVKLTAELSAYADNLESKGFPVIFDLRHLGLLLGIQPITVAGMVKNSERFYRTFLLPKRRGGFRTINSPYPSLKLVQGWIKQRIIDYIPVSEVAFAYKKDRSILNNAAVHQKEEALYKLDIVDFFGSIKLERVIKIFINCGYTPKLSYCLSQLCLLDGKLPQGASTSAGISNIIAKRLDRRLIGLSTDFGVNYSRYSDDLTFSGQNIPDKLKVNIKALVQDEGFTVNMDKEIFVKGYHKKKIVTGIAIHQQELRVPRAYRRATKLEVYKFLKFNYKVNPEEGNFDPYYPERLMGKLNHWIFVEKENQEPAELLKLVMGKKQQLVATFASDIQEHNV